jgi:hypothetical protein
VVSGAPNPGIEWAHVTLNIKQLVALTNASKSLAQWALHHCFPLADPRPPTRMRPGLK